MLFVTTLINERTCIIACKKIFIMNLLFYTKNCKEEIKMNTKQKVGTGISVLVASIVSLGDAKEAKAQYPAGCAPNRFTVMEESKVVVPYTTWQQQTVMVPHTQWVPQTTMVPHTQMVPQTQYMEQTIRTPVTYQRVDPCMPRINPCMPRMDPCRPRMDPCRPRCDLGRGIEQFFQGALSLPTKVIGGVLDPCCRPGPVCAPRVPYCAPRAVVPIVPYQYGCGPCRH